jgi:5-methylthioadenosine/S-adenosylhomocysteine deaminase
MQSAALTGTGTTLIKGGLVLRHAHAAAAHQDILVRHGRIEQLCPPGAIVGAGHHVIDATDRLLIPGLVNAHTHSHFTFGKGRNTDWTLELHQHATPGLTGGQNIRELNLLARVAAAEMISKGCTSCYDMVVQLPFPDPEGIRAIADGYETAGLRARIAMTIADQTVWHGLPGLYASLPPDGRALIDGIQMASAPQILQSCEAVLSEWSLPGDRISLALAPTIPLLCSKPLLLGAFELSIKYDVGLHTHLAESRIQAQASIAKFGKSLTQYLADIGYLGPQLTAAHAVWLDAVDMGLLARHGVKVAHNPGSNMRLGNGVASIRDLMDMGVSVGIGTDACTCSDQLNMFESMRQASLVSRIRSQDTQTWLSACDVFNMATVGGSHVMNQPLLGKLEKGFAADIVFLDLRNLNYVPLNDPLTQVVFNEHGGAVDSVMVDGELVYHHRQFTRFDYEALLGEAHASNARRVEMLAARQGKFALYDSVVKNYSAQTARTPLHINRYLSQP